MKPINDIEKLIKHNRLNLTAGSEMNERILGNILEELQQKTKSKPADTKPNIWRIIMKSKTTKFTTAAIMIIGVIIGIKHFYYSYDMSNVAWGQVVEQLNRYEKYKCRQRVIREQGPKYPTMDVYHLNLSLRRQEVEDGSVHIIDMRGKDAITVELYPDQKKAIVTKLIGYGPKKDPDIIDMVKRFEQRSTEKLGTKKLNGKILYGFRHKPNKYNDYTVWVDPKTKLPVEIELKHPTVGQTIFMDEFEFDFALDPSAFSTKIPDGYEVETILQDYRPREPKEITPENIRSGLNHSAYTVKKLPWMKKIVSIEALDPLGTKAIEYLTGVQSNEGNIIVIVQGNYYDLKRMAWIPKQQLVLECPSGVNLYTHPNGSIYAQRYLECFTKAIPEFVDYKNLSEERFARMIVMPDETALGFVANKKIGDENLREFVGALTKIEAN